MIAATRSVIFASALSACAGSPAPTTMARLDSLPDEHVEREQHLEATGARPAPESQKRKTDRWKRVEATAATAAAIVGSWFSTTKTVIIGVEAPLDENQLVDPGYRQRGAREQADPEPEVYDPGQLTPWVRLKPPAGE